MNIGDLVTFPDLVALEVRGIPGKLRIVMDAPLDRVLFVNFEAVELVANDRTMRRPRSNFIDPTETFNYIPNSEVALNEYKVELDLETSDQDDEVQVVPYEQYKREMKKSQKPTFYGWSSLMILRLHNCHLDQMDAEVFDDLGSLLQLSLDHNHIKVIPAFAFYGAPNLVTLSLSHNEILNLNYRDLAGLLNLRHLDLSYNNLTMLSEMTFPPFPKLDTLDLRYNAIQHIFAYTFDVMNTTRVLQLGDSEVEIDFTQSENAFDSLHALRELTILNGSHPKFDERIFTGLNEVRIVRMQGRFRELTFESFGSIPNVTEIILSRCAIETLSMDTFYNSELLEVIDLSRNRLAYLPPNLFDRQSELRELYLHHNQLSSLPSSFFAHTAAKVIRLTDNPWNCSCALLKTWKQAVTNTRIRRRKEIHCQPSYNDVLYGGDAAEVCREKTVYETVYDNKLTPRCDGGPANAKHRTVYYVFRRDLKCKVGEDNVDGRVITRQVKGVGQLSMTISEEEWAKSQRAKKMKIMLVLARKKEIERKHYRGMNAIDGKYPQRSATFKQKKKAEEDEDENDLTNQLEL